MKRALYAFTVFLLHAAFNMLHASGVDERTAQAVAVNFYKAHASTETNSANANLVYTRKEANNTVEFYIFNISPKGFVIVAADNNANPVIAYSLESNFDLASLGHTGMKDWMDQAASKIYYAIEQNIPANSRITGQWSYYMQANVSVTNGAKSRQSVGPLLQTNWGQETYYNTLCPYNTNDNQRCLTGCVATAMAQIMKYWNYPAQGTGAYSYLNAPPVFVRNYGNQSADFGSTNYNWTNMPASLTSANSDVATLMYHCGVSVAMDYGDNREGGSGAYVLASEVASWQRSAELAYQQNFNYNPNTLHGVYEADYSTADWLALIKTELDAGRPVQYEGQDPIAGGHTWVCDGYDHNDMLHMNWGWSGSNNGYFDISNLSAGRYNFTSGQAALIGIQPIVNLSVQAISSKPVICSGDSTQLTAVGTQDAISTYSWSPQTGLSCANCAVTSASPAVTTVYTVTRDSSGFTTTSTVTVNVHETAHLSTAVTDVSCNGGSNGAISVSVSGQSSAFSFVWSNGMRTSSLSNLFSGTYVLSIADGSACTSTASFFVSQPAALGVSISTLNVGYNKVYGSATANVSGGTKEFSYLWNTGDAGESISNLDAGTYTVTVTDHNGCNQTASTTINIETGINEVAEAQSFNAYPNPVSSQLHVQLNSLKGETTIALINELGQTVYNGVASEVQNTLDVSQFANGIYFVSTTQNGKTSSQKIVVSK